MCAAHANLLTVDHRQQASADNGLPAQTLDRPYTLTHCMAF